MKKYILAAFAAALLCIPTFADWKIQPSELAMILLCGLIVGACCLLWRVVAAKHNLDPIVLDLCSPSAANARNSLKTTGIVSRLPSISLILCARRLPQIYAAIVERISVYMVRAFSRPRSRNNGMHKNGFSAQVPLRIELPASRVLPGVPVRLRQCLKIRGVHDGDMAIGKRDEANRWIGWLDNYRPGLNIARQFAHFTVFGGLALLILSTGNVYAQNPTNVTGTLTDPSSVAYYPAQVTACLTPVTIDPTVGGKHVNPNIGANYCIGPVQTAPSGAFSMALYANGNITPGATQWIFTVQTAGSGPPAGKGAQAFSSAAVTISGSSQDVSTNLNSVGPTQLNSSSSSSSSSAGVFNFASYGAVDDDTTDNCANGAVANFSAAVNAYSGPGNTSAVIPASAKAFKLATAGCHFVFNKPIHLTIWGNIDCLQPATTLNCMQIGASGLSGIANYGKTQIDGSGMFLGGGNLANAGIEIEPYVQNAVIDGLQFLNFGAGNATLGNCSNFAILFDALVFEGIVKGTHWALNDGITGRCGYANPNGGASGQNTVFFNNNTMGGGTCSSTLILEGGAFGVISNNNLFGAGLTIRLQGQATRVAENSFDSNGCLNHGLAAPVQWGAVGASSPLVNYALIGNNVGLSGGGNSFMFAKAPDTAASTIANVTIIGNSGATSTPTTDTNTCIPSTSFGYPCYITANTMQTLPGGTINIPGYAITGGETNSFNSANQTANLGTTLIGNATWSATYGVTCGVILKVAATTSSTLPSCTVSWTDAFTSTAQSVVVTPTWTAGGSGCSPSTGGVSNTVGNACYGNVRIVATGAVAINVSTTGYASVGGTPMAYMVYSRVNID